MKKIILVLVLLVFVIGCDKQIDNSVTPPHQETAQKMMPDNQLPEGFERKVHRTFSILMPNEWKEVEYGNMIFYLPPGSEAVDPISEKVQVIAVGLPKDDKLPLKEILEAGLDDSKKLVPDLIMIKEEEVKIGSSYAVKMVFTGTILGKKFENTQISTINGGIMLHIIHNCFEENCRHLETYNKMVESLELIQYTDDKR